MSEPLAGAGWRPTAAHARAVIGAAAAMVSAVIAGRPVLAVISFPLAVAAVWAVATRPGGRPEVSGSIAHRTVREGEATRWRAVLRDADGADRTAFTLAYEPAFDTDPETGAGTQAVSGGAADGAVEVTVAVRSNRWGRREVGPALVAAESSFGAFRFGPVLVPAVAIDTLPLPAVFDNAAPVPDPQGLVGSNHSRRQGDGIEFATIRRFATGDRLRRIHWPVSLRTGSLHVAATSVDVDTHVLIVVDATSDVGASGGIDGEASSLDSSVRAAGALAEHFLRRGDRVGLRTSGTRQFVNVPSAAGVSHLRRILAELSTLEAGATRDRRWSAPVGGSSPGGLVIVLTPLLSAAALEHVATLAVRHARVVVVDTLPGDIVEQAAAFGPTTALAWRIRLLERSAQIDELARVGVPVTAWRGPGSLDTVLRDLARRANAPRLAR